MTFETKFHTGQVVWVMSGNRPQQVRIRTIYIVLNEYARAVITYNCTDGYDHKEKDIATTKDELKNKLFK